MPSLRRRRLSLLLATLGLTAALALPTAIAPARAQASGFAVVELFTSEGCSSCPPAEALLNAIDAEAHAKDQPVYALAFHVDYWNQLGWADRFSKASYAERQRAYANALERGRAYTPQMVVNGSAAFVGSSETKARAAIARGLKTAARVPLTVTTTVVQDARGRRAVRAEADLALPAHHQLAFALVESGLVSKVTRGENRGKTLTHRGVVRGLDVVTAGAPRALLPIPADADRAQLEVVAWVQDGRSLQIVAATRVAVR